MSDANERYLYAYELLLNSGMPLRPAPVERAWMDTSAQRAAYRCLPLVIANQAGWIVPSPLTFTAIWDGGAGKECVHLSFDRVCGLPPAMSLCNPIVASVDVADPIISGDQRVNSHFGNGIVTFAIPYLFRTPPGINLWVKGPSNYFKDGIQALEGIVETDWLPATFTMNWKLTRPHHLVRFEQGEPICMIVPIPRGLAEELEPIRTPLENHPELNREYQEWSKSRVAFNADLAKLQPEAVQLAWQRHYLKGETVTGQRAADHQTRLRLRDFTLAPNKPPMSGEPQPSVDEKTEG